MAVAFGAFSVKRIEKSLASLSNLPDFIEPVRGVVVPPILTKLFNC